MSKEDHTCKHKERKPKKPHYIPRPWGKPYNYKCFQCPFTCMEKSHLYNHMKYSLCKNSLSLLIESDWPYKKGNLLHLDQLRPLQQAHCLRTTAGKEEPEPATGNEERPRQESSNRDSEGTAKRTSKRPEPELLMTDMFSLEDQLLRAHSVENQLKHYKLSKTFLTAPELLSEQWRLLATSHTMAEGAQPRVSDSIPCYPPPPGLVDYQDPTELNRSILGVGYPLSPSLFSYMNSMNAISTADTNITVPTQAQLAQLPFLASAAQLLHPASGVHHPTDRTLLPSRFYYPFLCEHAFGAASTKSDVNKVLKTSANGLEPNPSYQPKVNLWKVPALRPGTTTTSSPTALPDPSYRTGDKLQAAAKEGKPGCGLKRTGALLVTHESPVEKRPTLGFTLDLLKNIQNTTPISMATEKLFLHSSFTNAQSQSRPAEQCYTNNPVSPVSESPSPPRCRRPSSQDSIIGQGTAEASSKSESAAALLSNLSNALQEYQDAECKISHLEKEDLIAQGHLWEHLNKIRSELSHIHHALERTARQTEGPLDLSIKKEQLGVTEVVMDGYQGLMGTSLKDDITTETEEDEEEVVKTEVLSPGGLGLRPSQAEGLWPGRTTKCEADSSVLLCTDGRPLAVFTDFPPSSNKNSKRPLSIQRLGVPQCPPSPLTATDS
ncbi:proline-rich protein 35-like [Salmo trutta]|uniref:proline-rich protein 35-like n=1 Tax=Salmo trutta TaxID=8032 RepID=UPI001131CFC6|nr:proline-rich protein 35-like [Salmo trutta]